MQQEEQQKNKIQIPLKQSYNKGCIKQRTNGIFIPPQTQQNIKACFSILPAWNNSVVLVCRQSVKHVSEKGQILNQLPVQIIFQAILLSQKIVLVASSQTKEELIITLTQWNMETNSTIKVNHKRTSLSSEMLFQFFLFHESKLCCVIVESQLKSYVAYYRYPLLTEKDEPVHTTQIHENLPQERVVVMINNRSGIRWVDMDYCQDESIKVFTYSYEQSQKTDNQQGGININQISGLKIHKFQKKIICKDQDSKLRFLDMWQVRPKIFFLCIQVLLPLTKQKYLNFIWKQATNEVQPVFFGVNENTFCYIQFIGHYRKFKQEKVVLEQKNKSIYYQKIKSIFYPIVYVDVGKDLFKVICIQKWRKFSCCYYHVRLHYFCPSYDLRSFYNLYQYKTKGEYMFEEKDTEKFEQFTDEFQNQQQQYKQDKSKITEKLAENEKIQTQTISQEKNEERTTIKIKHRKIKYFQNSYSQYAAWVLTCLIQNCDEDLIYYVGLLIEQQ